MTAARRFLALFYLLTLAGSAGAQSRGNDLLRSNPRFLGAFREVVCGVSQSVVRVRCDGHDTALGFIVGADGWIVTKANDLTGTISCRLPDRRELDATLVGIHELHDLALLRVEAKGLPAVELGDSASVRAGNWVASAGQGQEPVAIGVVSVPTRDVSAKKSNDAAKAPYLGVSLETADAGVRITEVIPGTAASRAGLQGGDIILRVSDTAVRDPDEFVEQIARRRPGDAITLRVLRDGAEQDIPATLQARPSSARADMQNRMGSELSSRRAGYALILHHDSVLRPNDCGGPLVDLEGRVIGINISRAGRVETWAVPAEVVKSVLAELKSGRLAPKTTPTSVGKDDEPASRVDALLAAMHRRLRLMPDVARAKWNEGRPIRDAQRETALLDRLASEAAEHNLPAAEVRRFFAAQMEAARLVQENLFEDWNAGAQGAFTDAQDLRKTLRPRVDQASTELLTAYARLHPHLRQPEVRERLHARADEVLVGEGINDTVRNIALQPLLRR